MASYNWVAGSGTWDASDTTHWAASSGGAGGAGFPTNADTVFFDGNSGGGTVTVSGAVCAVVHYNSGGATLPTLSGGTITCTATGGGSLDFSGGSSPAATMTSNISIIGSGGCTFASMASGWSGSLSITTSGGTNTISQLNTSSTVSLNHTGGTVTFSNGGTFSANSIAISGVGTRTINLGTGTFNLAGTGNIWNCSTPTNLTLNASTSTINFTSTSGTGKTFTGGGKTYSTLGLPTGASNPPVTITGANTFGTITTASAGVGTLTLPASTTTTVTNFTIGGSAANIYTLASSSAGTAATLSKASGAVNVTSLSIKDSTASGGAVFNARFSTSVSGNTGWNFVLENYSKIKLQAVNRAAVW